jgi:hypothetical protein
MRTYTLARNDGDGAFRAAADPPPRTTTLLAAVPSLFRDPHFKDTPGADAARNWDVVLGDNAIVVTPDETFRIPIGGHRRAKVDQINDVGVILYYDGIHLSGGWHVVPSEGTLVALTQADCVVVDGTLTYFVPVGLRYYNWTELQEKDGHVAYTVGFEDDPAQIESYRIDNLDEALSDWQMAPHSSMAWSPRTDTEEAKTQPRRVVDQLQRTYNNVQSLTSFLSSVESFTKTVSETMSSLRTYRFRVVLHNGSMTCVLEKTLGTSNVAKRLEFDSTATPLA